MYDGEWTRGESKLITYGHATPLCPGVDADYSARDGQSGKICRSGLINSFFLLHLTERLSDNLFVATGANKTSIFYVSFAYPAREHAAGSVTEVIICHFAESFGHSRFRV